MLLLLFVLCMMNFCCCFVFICFLFFSFLFSTGERRAPLIGVRRPMTQDAARRIQSATARAFGGLVPKRSFSSRAQSTADRRAYWSKH